MKVVLDTNVLISALLNPHGAPSGVLSLIINKEIILCHDSRIINEYEAVLRRERFNFDPDEIDIIIDFFIAEGEAFSPSPLILNLPDPFDLPFVETAITAKADFLITGNIKHFPNKLFKAFKVITPADFIKLGRLKN